MSVLQGSNSLQVWHDRLGGSNSPKYPLSPREIEFRQVESISVDTQQPRNLEQGVLSSSKAGTPPVRALFSRAEMF